jgi:hypothetical protein
VSVLDGFYTVWSKARDTFGEGTPQTGEQFDASPQLSQAQATLDRAAPGSHWTGTSANAYGAANTRHQEVIGGIGALDKRLAAQVTYSAEVVAHGRTQLDGVRTWVTDAAASVPPGKDQDQKLLPIANRGIGEVVGIVQKTNSELGNVGGKIRALSAEYDKLGMKAFVPKEGPELGTGGDGKKDEEKTPAELGKEDSEAFQNGTLTDTQRERIEANTHLSPEQTVALNGGSATMPPDQMAYLQNFSRSFGDKTPAEIKAMMDKNGATGGRAMDAFQLASNPNIKTGLPGTEPPSTDSPASGGKYALPDGIQKVLDGPAMYQPFSEDIRDDNGNVIIHGEPTGPLQPSQGLNELADIIQRGDGSLQNGTALDAGLMAKSQEMLAQSSQNPIQQGTGPGFSPNDDVPRWAHTTVDPTLQNMLNAVNKDDMVIHDTVTGQGGKAFLDNLTQHQWQDDGLAAGGLFDWIGESAANDSTGRAAETAHTLADYTSTNHERLLNLPGTDHQSLGEVNPELTRDLARSFSPYFDDMVGMNTGDSDGQFAPLDKDGSVLEPVNTRHLMSVLESDHPPLDQPIDPKAPATASQIVMDSTQQHVNKYIDIAAQSAIDGKPGQDDFAMKSAGKLQAAMDLGAYDERFDATNDEWQAQVQSHDLLSKSYDLVMAGVGEVPGGGPAATVGGLFKDVLVGPEPVQEQVGPPQPRDMFPLQMEMAAALAEQNGGDPGLRADVQKYIDGNGNFIIPPQDGTGDYGEFSVAITSYLSSAGAQPGVITDMLQTYWNTYSGAMFNPTKPPGS